MVTSIASYGFAVLLILAQLFASPSFASGSSGQPLQSEGQAADQAAGQATAQASSEWTLQNVSFSKKIRLGQKSNAKVTTDVLFLFDGESSGSAESEESVEIREFSPSEIESLSLSADEVRILNKVRREVLLTTLRGTLADQYSGLMIANSDEGYSLLPKTRYVRGETKVVYNPILKLLKTPESPLPGKSDIGSDDVVPKKKFLARVKAFAKFLNEAIILSTVREYRNYRKQMKDVSPKMDEFGLSLNFKLELQLGVGSFNFSRSGAFVLDVGYNKTSQQISLRTGLRSEALGDGIAFPAIKFEIRAYESASGVRVGDAKTKGHAWYPPSLPALSLVLDSSDRYLAQGVAFSLNAGDFLIPGGFLLNAVNDYSETEKRTTLVQMKNRLFDTYRTLVDRLLRRPKSCQFAFQ